MLNRIKELGLETFGMREVCQATGLSRAFLIKLEQKGILTPYSVDERTGYRKYTIFEISRVLQYRLMRDMDISLPEISDYFADRGKLQSLIERMKVRQNLIQRAIEELELRLSDDETYSFSYIELPEVICYCGTGNFVNPKEVETFTARLTEEAIRLGHTKLSYEQLFSIRYDTARDGQRQGDEKYEAMVCIPVETEGTNVKRCGRLGHIEKIRGGRAFSMLYRGGYHAPDYFKPVFTRFWEEIAARNIKVTGAVRSIGIVAPYVGTDIDQKDYVFRFAIAVEE